MSKRTVLYISRHYAPTSAAAGLRAGRLVSALRSAGIKTIVVTTGSRPGIEEVTPDLVLCRLGPTGQLPADISPADLTDTPVLGRLPGPDSEPNYGRNVFGCCRLLIQRYRPDTIFATAPPFYLLDIAGRLSRSFDLPLVAEFRDAWYTAMPWPYTSVLSRRSARLAERACLLRAAKIITVTETYKKHLADAFGPAIAEKIVHIPHGFEPSEGTAACEPNASDFTILYTGQLRGIDIASGAPAGRLGRSVVRTLRRIFLGANFCEKLRLDWMSPHYLMRAIAMAAGKNADFRRDVQLVFAGERFGQIDRWSESLDLSENVRQLGPLSPDDAGAQLGRADLLLLSLYGIKGMAYHWCVPSKTYGYLACGKPILSLLPPGEAYDIVKRAGVGFFAAPDDVDAIAALLLELYNRHNTGGIQIDADWDYINRFDIQHQRELFVESILSVGPDR